MKFYISPSKKQPTDLENELQIYFKDSFKDIQAYARYLFDRSATLLAVVLIGFLSKKYLKLVNDESIKTSQIINIGSTKKIFSISTEYSEMLLANLRRIANLVWNKKDGKYVEPEFRIVTGNDSLALGPAVLGLI